MEYFQQYESVPKIQSLTKRLATVQSALQDSVLDDFKLLMGTADVKLTTENIERLGNACLVINALGPKVGRQGAAPCCVLPRNCGSGLLFHGCDAMASTGATYNMLLSKGCS